MHTDARSAAALVEELCTWPGSSAPAVQMVVAPPYPFLAEAVARISRRDVGEAEIIIAAQNCHQEEQGAFTGEVSVPMLRSLGVQACIVGHSERRQYYGETDAVVGQKVAALLRHGLMPIYCCGELREERESGRHFEVVGRQLREALSRFGADDLAKVVVAYEPVWAIGTGLTASPEQAREMHAFLRQELKKLAGEAGDAIPILYGGSCKPSNAAGLFSGRDIDGGLIGGASLSAKDFIQLVQIAHQAKTHS